MNRIMLGGIFALMTLAGCNVSDNRSDEKSSYAYEAFVKGRDIVIEKWDTTKCFDIRMKFRGYNSIERPDTLFKSSHACSSGNFFIAYEMSKRGYEYLGADTFPTFSKYHVQSTGFGQVHWSAPNLDATWEKSLEPIPDGLEWSSHSFKFKVRLSSDSGKPIDPVADSVYHRFQLKFTKLEVLP